MAHARAWAATRFPGALTLEAFPRIAWIPEKVTVADLITARPAARRRPISIQEDLFGCFDLIVFPTQPYGAPGLQLVQVTTMNADGTDRTGTVAHRKQKVSEWYASALDNEEPEWLDRILLLGWVPRKHFRVWELWGSGWREGPRVTAPLPRTKPRKRKPAPRDGPRSEALDHPRSQELRSPHSDDPNA